MSGLRIRPAHGGDLAAINAIFEPHIRLGHATFRSHPWTLEEREAWFRTYDGGRHQVLVGEHAGRVIGCAYSSPYRATAPFDATVETSIYLEQGFRRAGTGTALYAALLEHLSGQPVHVAVAGVALPNAASLALHRKLGFEEVGTFRDYARKNGVWISSVWFQRFIGTA